MLLVCLQLILGILMTFKLFSAVVFYRILNMISAMFLLSFTKKVQVLSITSFL